MIMTSFSDMKSQRCKSEKQFFKCALYVMCTNSDNNFIQNEGHSNFRDMRTTRHCPILTYVEDFRDILMTEDKQVKPTKR